MLKIEISAGSAEELLTQITDLAASFGGATPAIETTQRRTRKKAEAPVEPVEAKAEEPQPEPEAAAEPEAKPEPEAPAQAPTDGIDPELAAKFADMDIPAARAWIVDNYLNAHFSAPDERTKAFRAVVGHFIDADGKPFGSLSAMPQERMPEVLAHVAKLIEGLKK
jgi:hypothetical protein